MRLSTWVALRCREPLFQRFMEVDSEAAAAAKVRTLCGVQSRGEIDSNPSAELMFHQIIRRPFIDFHNNTQEK